MGSTIIHLSKFTFSLARYFLCRLFVFVFKCHVIFIYSSSFLCTEFIRFSFVDDNGDSFSEQLSKGKFKMTNDSLQNCDVPC